MLIGISLKHKHVPLSNFSLYLYSSLLFIMIFAVHILWPTFRHWWDGHDTPVRPVDTRPLHLFTSSPLPWLHRMTRPDDLPDVPSVPGIHGSKSDPSLSCTVGASRQWSQDDEYTQSCDASPRRVGGKPATWQNELLEYVYSVVATLQHSAVNKRWRQKALIPNALYY
jgi:hypothetical protein